MLDDVPLVLWEGQKATLENSACIPYSSGVSYPRPDDDRPPLLIPSCAPSGHWVSVTRDAERSPGVIIQASLTRLKALIPFTTADGRELARPVIQSFEVHETADIGPHEAVSYIKSVRHPLQVELSRLD